MNKITLGTALAALSLAVPGAALAQARAPAATIVVVNTGRVFSECTACRAAQTQLQALITSAQQRQQTLAAPIQTEAQSLQAAATAAQAMAAGPARTAAEASVRTRAAALDARQNAANQELQRLEQSIQSTRANVSRQLNERLTPIVTQAMTTHGANIAMDTDATLSSAPALDITNEVLAALNAQLPAVSVTPMPQGQPGAQPQGR
jgi:Skp family chaperone for outer membrane proteins